MLLSIRLSMSIWVAPPFSYCEWCWYEHGWTNTFMFLLSHRGTYAEVELPGHRVIVDLILWDIAIWFSTVAALLYALPSNARGWPFFFSCCHLVNTNSAPHCAVFAPKDTHVKLFIHSTHYSHLLSTYYMLNTVLDPGTTEEKMLLPLQSFYLSGVTQI